jgi:hypothetical protein
MEHFPNRPIPNVRTFLHVVQRLRDRGSFKLAAHERDRQRPQRIINVEEAVLESVEARRETSTRRLESQHRVSRSTIWRILKAQ